MFAGVVRLLGSLQGEKMSTMTTPKGTVLPFLDLKGKDYLQVAHRLVWFREEKPDWSIETEFTVLNDGYALAKATVKNEAGRVMSTAHKREDQKHFADFAEKAEAGAVGRALAYVGYGAQFAPELHEGDDVVDSPTPKPKAAKPAATPAKPTKSDVEVCDCGNNMMVSKYGPEPRPWYCGKCKATRPR